MNNEQMQGAMLELQGAMVVMAHMETRETERLIRQEREVEELAISRARVEQRVLRLEEESARFRRRTEQNLAEIAGKLKGPTAGRPQ